MFASLANWWRTPAAERAVLPVTSIAAFSSTMTSVQPRAARCQATDEPTIPAPMMTIDVDERCTLIGW